MSLLSLAAVCSAAYPAPARAPAQAHRVAAQPMMAMQSKVDSLVKTGGFTGELRIDQYGYFEDRKPVKDPVKILARVEELKVLSSLAEAGVLSSAEQSGLFSKLERAGAFSSVEKLLPLADDLKLLSTAEALLNVPSGNLLALAALLVVGEFGLITVLPDELVVLQVGTGAVVGLAAVTLVAISFLFSLLQGTD